MKKKRTHKEFVEQVKLINSEIEIIGKYEGFHIKILIKYKGELFKLHPQLLLKGNTPKIRASVNPTEYFINKVKITHNNKYDYSLVDYKTDRSSKIKIICPTHGVFEQTAKSHLKGRGCIKCGYESLNNTWKDSEWEKAGLNSKNFAGFQCYIIECWNENERFFKIGKTYLGVSVRFRKKSILPYQWRVIKIYEGAAKFVCTLERQLHKLNKHNKYIPELKFNGMQECFNKIEKING